MRSLSRAGDRPAVRRAAGRRAALIAVAAATASVVLAVALIAILNRPPDTPPAGPAAAPEDVIDLVPEPLDAEAEPMGREAMTGLPALEAGGWIRTVDQTTGELAQQYRFERLDPNPPGLPANWVRMDRPVAEIYLGDGRALRLSGDSAVAHLPHRVLESATLSGDVTIRLFEPPPGRMVDTARDEPLLEVRTPEAAFDNVIGEVRCPGAFRVDALSHEFAGRGLSVLVNDRQKPVKPTVDVERVDFVRLVPTRRRDGAEAPRPEADEGPGPAPAPQPASPETEAQEPEPPQYYRLTLHDDVRIRQGDGATGRRMAGDELTILFTTESRGVEAALAAVPAPAPPAAPMLSPLSALAAASIAAVPQTTGPPGPATTIAPPPADDDVYITCAGRLTLVPLESASAADLLPSPRDARLTLTGSPVRLEDAAEQAAARGQRLVYEALSERLELAGSAEWPLVLETPRLAAGAETFELKGELGTLTGRGWLAALRGDDVPAPVGPLRTQLDLEWANRAELEFDPAGEDEAPGGLRRAAFHGDVLAVAEQGSLACRDVMELRLTPGVDRRRPVPTALTASGDVRAADAGRTLWADDLHVALRPAASPAAGEPAGGAGGDFEISRFTADGDVQVRLGTDGRAFADRLVGDADAQTIELHGDDVALARGRWLLDGGRTVTLDQRETRARWAGPGTARLFGAALPVGADARVARPASNGATRLTAVWDGSMRYEQQAAAVDLEGGVTVVSAPDARRRTELRSATMRLLLEPEPDSATTPRAAPQPGAPAPAPGGAGRVRRIVAAGGARLEDRIWPSEARAAEPRLFYVAGEQLEYDALSGEALVPGPGHVLLRDLRPAARDVDVPLGGRGTTAFSWRSRLHMTRRSGTLYDIVMDGGIEMRHLGPDGSASTLACGRLEATVDRPAPDAEAPPETVLAGAPAELRSVAARHDVFFRTPQRDVACDSLLYDLASGVARLSADAGDTVTIYTHGTPQPIHVRRAQWNLRTDALDLGRGAGGGAR